MKHYFLIYDTAPDYLERRPQFRDAHLARAWAAAERGEILLAGAISPPDERMGILLFQGNGPEAAESFAREDPYVQSGIVEKWRVVEWLTVVGDNAVNPVKPE